MEAIAILNKSLPATTVKHYFTFNGDAPLITAAYTETDFFKLSNKDVGGNGTGVKKGVEAFFTQEGFSNSDKQKVLILVTDGASDDGYPTECLNAFKNNENGIVFTVGFNHDDSELKKLAGAKGVANNDDYYIHADSAESIKLNFANIGEKLTSMVIDPMGPTVDFDIADVTGDNLSSVGNTIFWKPTPNDPMTGEVVNYKYSVMLNASANREEDVHMDIPLNNTTLFRYGIIGTEENATTQMHELPFPIPHATYAYSSVQVHWVDENENALIAPTEVERIVSDYVNDVDDGKHEVYTPAFTTDYGTKNIKQRIDIPGSEAYYMYVKTTYKANGDEATGVNPANAVAHEVVHHYVRVEPPKVGNLELEKVIPDANNTMEADRFTFAVKGPDGFTGSVSYTVNGVEKTGTVDADGVLTLTRVKANDVILLKDVPVGDYAVTETAEAGNTLFYDATYSNEGKATVVQDETASLTVTNKPTETVFTKIWDDEGNRYSLRPTADDFVKKLLVLSGESGLKAGCQASDFTVEDEAVIVIRTNVEGLETNAWHVVALGLPKLATGYSYYLAEMDVSPYEAKDIILTADFNYTRDNMLNKNSFNVFAESTENKVLNCLGTTVSATVTKSWNDNFDQDGLRPGSLLVTLSNGQTETLSAANNWTATVNGLPKYNENGQEITYTWTEGELPEGYELTNTSVNGTITTLTNTHTPELTNVTVTKVWAGDADYAFFTRPEIVTVKLLANGLIINEVTVTPDENGSWTYIFKNLPKYQDGMEIDYTVSEDAVAGYTFQITGDMTEGFTITNTLETVDIDVTKIWDDENNLEGFRPDSIVINLIKQAGEDGEPEILCTEEVTGSKTDISWSFSWSGLPKYEDGEKIQYTVNEEPLSDYEVEVTGDQQTGFTITNSRTPELTSVTVKKVWDDAEDQDGKRPDHIVIRLLANGEEAAVQEVTATDEWVWKFENLPKFKDGQEVKYSITEDIVTDYESSVNGFEVTNSYTPETIDVSGSKTWEDENDQDGKRPDSISISLLANGERVRGPIPVTAADNWSWIFKELPKYKAGAEIKYTVEEKTVPGYTTVVEGVNVTNSYTPEETSITVTKVWDDAEDQDGKRSGVEANMILSKTVNGTTTDLEPSVPVGVDNGWSHTWDNLPVYEGGVKVVYSVREELANANGYTSDSKAAKEVANGGKVTVTNSYTPELTSATVKKTWDDASNQDGKRPATLTVTLSDGKEVELNEANDWTATVDNLPKYKDGQEIKYTWTEGELPEDYELTKTDVTGTITTLTNSYTPELTSATVTKVWDDKDDQDGKRNGVEANMILSKTVNGEITDIEPSVAVGVDNGWSHTWDNLPVYEGGVKVVYSVREELVNANGYTSDSEAAKEATNDGTVKVTNSYTPEVTEATVKKVWDDASNQDGKRPATLTVTLSDGKEVELNEGNSWTATVENLPKYENGELITYSWTEDETALPEGYKLTDTSVSGTVTTLTNSYTPELTSATVKKTWDDASNQDGKRPATLTVTLSDGK
ncbi:MAG: Cna B-type domain-containing protein, partial [Clostridia bacterium]|nr:Cna B-type domain-containing protein [Clostridia bacterium]